MWNIKRLLFLVILLGFFVACSSNCENGDSSGDGESGLYSDNDTHVVIDEDSVEIDNWISDESGGETTEVETALDEDIDESFGDVNPEDEDSYVADEDDIDEEVDETVDEYVEDTLDEDIVTDWDYDTPVNGEKRIVGYFISWGIYARNYNVSDIPAEKVTHINYAFANISDDGEVILGDSWADVEKAFDGDTWDQPIKGNFNQLIKLKRQYPHLKTLISIGGWTWSGKFSDVARTDASRQKFARSAVEFMKKYGFDGIDIDWEYPVSGGKEGNVERPEDKHNFTLLLKKIREELDKEGGHYLLTAAIGAGPDKIANLEVSEIMKYVDWVNIMAYDYNGAWNEFTGHHAPLYGNPNDPIYDKGYYIDSTVNTLLSAGATPDKLVLGVPFYGRAWKGVPSTNNGLFQSSDGTPPPGTWDDWQSGNTGVNDYWQILEFAASGEYTRYWDDRAKAAYLYSPSKYNGHFISYMDREALSLKLQYIGDKNLGGIMFWDFTGDSKDSDTSLLELIYETYVQNGWK